jgi:hypothetical protein
VLASARRNGRKKGQIKGNQQKKETTNAYLHHEIGINDDSNIVKSDSACPDSSGGGGSLELLAPSSGFCVSSSLLLIDLQ